MSQCERLLDRLQVAPITPMEAWSERRNNWRLKAVRLIDGLAVRPMNARQQQRKQS